MRVAAPREAMARLEPLRDHERLVAATHHPLYLKLLQCLHSLRQRILDHGSTAATSPMEAVRADLASLLVGKRGCDDLLGEVLLEGRDAALVGHVAAAALRIAGQVDDFRPQASAETFIHYKCLVGVLVVEW